MASGQEIAAQKYCANTFELNFIPNVHKMKKAYWSQHKVIKFTTEKEFSLSYQILQVNEIISSDFNINFCVLLAHTIG